MGKDPKKRAPPEEALQLENFESIIDILGVVYNSPYYY